MKEKSKAYFVMTVFQIAIGVLGIIVFAVAAFGGTLNPKNYAILIIALLLVVLGIADLRRISRLKKTGADLMLEDGQEKESE